MKHFPGTSFTKKFTIKIIVSENESIYFKMIVQMNPTLFCGKYFISSEFYTQLSLIVLIDLYFLYNMQIF